METMNDKILSVLPNQEKHSVHHAYITNMVVDGVRLRYFVHFESRNGSPEKETGPCREIGTVQIHEGSQFDKTIRGVISDLVKNDHTVTVTSTRAPRA